MNPDASNRLEELVAHAAWVRGLAAQLVAGPHDADDIAQEVWRATLAADRQRIRSPRAWLAGAVRNVVTMHKRGEGRRERREQAVERPVRAPATADLVAEQELRRQLISLVDSLPEGERQVLLLRFWNDLPPRAVGKQLGIPVNTVRSRTARALERLRTQLDGQHGNRKAWCLGLVPLLDPKLLRRAGLAPAAGGAKVTIAAAAALTVLVGGYAVYASGTSPSLPDMSRSTQASEALARFDRPAAASVDSSATERSMATAPTSIARTVVGTVVDLDGKPVAGAVVHPMRRWVVDLVARSRKIAAADLMVTTDANGAFTLPPPGFASGPSDHELEIGEVTHADYIAEQEWTNWPIPGTARIEMRPAPAVELDIEVVEKETGLPVPRFSVSLVASWGKSSSADPAVVIVPDPQQRRLIGVDPNDPEGETTSGRLQRRVRLVHGVDNQLVVHVPGCESIRETLLAAVDPGTSVRRRYEVDLTALAQLAGNTIVRGVVVDAVTGQPIAGVGVSLVNGGENGKADVERPASTTTRSDGRFVLGVAPQARPGRLRVQHPDYEPQEFDLDGTDPQHLRVMPLPSIALTVTERGQPAPGMHLLVLEGNDRERRRVVTDRNGQVLLRRLAPDTVSLHLVPDAWAPDEQAIDSIRVRLQRGERCERTFEFRGDDRVEVYGRVVADRDLECAIVPVFLPLDGDHGWIQARSSGGTSYFAGGVRRGRYLVLLVPADDKHRDGPFALHGVVDVQAAFTEVLDFVVPTGMVRGQLFGLDDATGLHVVALPRLPQRSLATNQLFDSAHFTTMMGAPVDEHGRFDLRRIADGPCELQLRRGSEVLATRQASVALGLADIGVWQIVR